MPSQQDPKSARCVPDPFLLLGVGSGHETNENRARVARPFLPRAGDAIHPALREREGSGFETNFHRAKIKIVKCVVNRFA